MQTRAQHEFSVSSSKLGVYGDCPKLAEKLYNISGKQKKKIDDLPSIPAQFGTVVHELFEHGLTDDDEIRAKWDEIWQRDTINIGSDYGEEPNLLSSVVDYETGLRLIKEFKYVMPPEQSVLAREHKFEHTHGPTGITFRGTIDVVFAKDGCVGIFDYKTWRRARTREQIKESVQLNLYAIAGLIDFARKADLSLDKVWVGYGMVRYGTERGVWLTSKELVEVLNNAANLAIRMKTAEKFPGKVCHRCAYCPLRGIPRTGCKLPDRQLPAVNTTNLKKLGMTREEYLIDHYYKSLALQAATARHISMMKQFFMMHMESGGLVEMGVPGKGLRIAQSKITLVDEKAIQAMGLTLQEAWDAGLLKVSVVKAREFAKLDPKRLEAFEAACGQTTQEKLEKR